MKRTGGGRLCPCETQGRGQNLGIGENEGHLSSQIRGASKKEIKGEDGSAVIEFVLLAIPLMVPLVMYLTAVRENSTINSDLHNLARQSARAFITSGDESYEPARIQSLLNTFELRILRPHGIAEVPSISVECSATPCLTPDSRVRVTASLNRAGSRLSGIFRFLPGVAENFSASDTQIVDAWR